MNNTTNTTITELELVVSGTNELAIADAAFAELVATLQPIADRIETAVTSADECVVTDEDSADVAATCRDAIIADLKQAEEALRGFEGGIINRLHSQHRAWTALLALFKTPLDGAAKTIKGKVIGWQNAEAEKARKEQARLQAEADERARKERDRLEKEAAKLKTPEKQEERREAARQVVAPVVSVEAPRAAVKTQRRWCVARVDAAAFIKAAAADEALIGYVTINEGTMARAKAANSRIEIPGVTFELRAI